MIDTKTLDEIINKLIDAVPEPIKNFEVDLQKEFHRILQQAFSSFDLVQREEFDVQRKVLAKTREKITQLEERIQKLEQQNEE